MGCDPDDRPTAAYIEKHANAYNNANFTTWAMAGYTMPVNLPSYFKSDEMVKG